MLADEQFDQPGEIELLLGQDVCRQLFLPGVKRGTKREPEARLTVFGWTIAGNYSASSRAAKQTAITYTASSTPELELSIDVLLRKFFEIEEPPAPQKKRLSPTEEQVEQHFEETHRYIAEEKRYMVRLPRVDNKMTLGESKTTAVNRARSNERSLIRKGRLQDFQNVMAEYLELKHARKSTSRWILQWLTHIICPSIQFSRRAVLQQNSEQYSMHQPKPPTRIL